MYIWDDLGKILRKPCYKPRIEVNMEKIKTIMKMEEPRTRDHNEDGGASNHQGHIKTQHQTDRTKSRLAEKTLQFFKIIRGVHAKP